VCGLGIGLSGSKHLHLPDLEFLILHPSQPPQPRHPKGPPHLSRRFEPPHTDIECIALNIRFRAAKTPPLPDLEFPIWHPHNYHSHLTPNIPRITSGGLNQPPLISSAMHSIFGFGGENPSPARSRVPYLTPPQPL
jgi:hypothetical protein